MKIEHVVSFLDSIAHPSLQESYDNTGLVCGSMDTDCTGIICSLDATPEVIEEAVAKGCNLVVAHHPIIFSGLKKINGKNYIERAIIHAIKNDIAIFAIHTSLDNVVSGVSGRVAEKLGLRNVHVLSPKSQTLKKLFTFVPHEHAEKVRAAIFEAGAGQIGNYSECSFNTEGFGTFKGNAGSDPYVGKQGEQHRENEIKIELVFPAYLENKVVNAMKQAHPYEEVAYDIISLSNAHPSFGAGAIGDLAEPISEKALLGRLKEIFEVPVVRHTSLLERPIQRIAVCGGAGSFLIPKALSLGAHAYITADVKYHEFFDADRKMLIADVGHFESEQFTINLLQEVIAEKFPTFAVLKTEVKTNPIHYFF